MASLALGLVGAGIGSLAPAGFTFLGMSGAGLGWAVGSALGNILFAPDGPNTQGPRLSDLSVQTSTRGQPIPKVYGTSKIAGNVIWTAGIQETATTQDVGGKGGGGATHTSYTYSCSFAIGLCQGEIAGVRRIWADSVLIYDRGEISSADDLSVSDLAGVTIYTGSEAQEPDPTIEASEGVGNVPGFRGLACVVFENFQLERYGNRIPNFTFEVVEVGSNDWQVVSGVPNMPGHSYDVAFSADGRYLAVGHASGGYLTVIDTTDLSTVSGTPTLAGICYGVAFSDDGNYLACAHGSSPYLTVLNVSDWSTVSGTPTLSGTGRDVGFAPGSGHLAIGHYGGYKLTVLDTSSWSAETVPYIGSSGFNTAFDVSFSPDGSLLSVGFNASPYLTVVETATWTEVSGTPTLPSAIVGASFSYDGAYLAAGYQTGSYYKIFDVSTWGEVTGLPSIPWTVDDVSFSDDGKYLAIAHSSGDGVTVLDAETFVKITGTPAVGAAPYGISFSPTNNYLAVASNTIIATDRLTLISTARIAPEKRDVADIIQDLCGRVGVTDIDTSGVTDTVTGYVRSSPMTARAAIEPLLTAFQCGAAESDYTLKFTPLTGSSSLSIDYADLAGEISISRDIETELPRRITVSYADEDYDYLPAVQSAQRIHYTGQIVNEISAQLPISSDADTTAKLSEKILYRAWTERERYDWRLTQQFAYLDAGDVVTINSDTASHVVRITNGQMGLPGLIECSGVATRASLYSSSVSGIASSYTSQSLVLVGDTLFEIMDLPALRDADATTAGFYVAVYGERANWTSGIVYRSTDGGSSWSGLVTTSTEATMGVTTDALGDGDHKTWDETNTVNISMYNGTLSSATTDNVLNGSNAALIGDELIHFRAATLEGDGTYTLSGLLRGMKGTEHETGTHAIGDRFVLLNTTSIYRVSADYSKLNVTDKFKAVTNGQFLDSVTDTTDVTFSNLNAKPLSPCQIYGTRDGSNNLTINWQRRSRLTETSLDDPGLGEATELYEVHVMSGGVAVRVIQSTTNSTTYTAAQQTADGLTPGDPVTVNIYQVSDTVGRGYVRSETI